MSTESTAVLALAVPLIAALVIPLLARMPNLREAVSLISALVLFLLVATLWPDVMAGARPRAELLEVVPGLALVLEIEPLGMLFALVASFLWIVTSVYSIGYMRGNQEHSQTRFYTCFAIALSSAVGVAFAGNMFTLFIFYEVLTLSTYPLVTHAGTEEARRAGRLYLGILLGTSIGLQLVAIVWTWLIAGTLDFETGGILAGKTSQTTVAVLFVLYVFGIGKAALMPIHRWLPAAMVAPTPVSALLHAVAVVKAGVFTVVKVIVYVFGIDLLRDTPGSEWLVYVSGFTIIVASVIALRADDLKRRLAYSTVSQLSYVVIAAAMLTPVSILGAALHIVAHAFGKITLFFCAGSIYTAAHKTRVSELAGIGRRMPWTMGAFAIASLSMIGVPPTVGFASKWYILQAAVERSEVGVVLVIVASTLLNAAYFLPIVYAAFMKAPAGNPQPRHGEAPLGIVFALTVTALGTVALFFGADAPILLAQRMFEGAQ